MANQRQLSRAFNGLTLTEKSPKLLESVLNHIILPRYIPNDANDDLRSQEAAILSELNKTVRSLSNFLPDDTVDMFAHFVAVHKMRTPEAIAEQINKLQPGHTFAMYVQCQKTVFMCHMPANVSIDAKPCETTPVIVATFPGRIGTKFVYSQPLDMEVRLMSLNRFETNFVNLIASTELQTKPMIRFSSNFFCRLHIPCKRSK